MLSRQFGNRKQYKTEPLIAIWSRYPPRATDNLPYSYHVIFFFFCFATPCRMQLWLCQCSNLLLHLYLSGPCLTMRPSLFSVSDYKCMTTSLFLPPSHSPHSILQNTLPQGMFKAKSVFFLSLLSTNCHCILSYEYIFATLFSDLNMSSTMSEVDASNECLMKGLLMRLLAGGKKNRLLASHLIGTLCEIMVESSLSKGIILYCKTFILPHSCY